VRVHRATESTVTLQADRQTLHRGLFGLWFGEGGHAVVGHIRSRDLEARTVTREVLRVTGDLGAARTASWTGHAHPGPETLGRRYRDVAVPVSGGVAPAWMVEPARPARRRAWAVHIHSGRGVRASALRSLAATDALGMTSLVVSYRGDGEAPSPPGGVSALGSEEWQDVDAAVGFALQNGADRVVLIGWSLGAAIALQLTERSEHSLFIERLVLIAPVTDGRAVIRAGVAERGLPGWVATRAIRLLSDPRRCARAGLTAPIDFARLDWTRPERLTVPALVLHSAGDRDVPLTSSVLFALANPRLVRLVELPRAQHGWEFNVDPAAFNRAMIEFLEPAAADELLGPVPSID
jgi:pimeloyl-ACP methyl ester carboxylesterase